jgi:hypothetical protein
MYVSAEGKASRTNLRGGNRKLPDARWTTAFTRESGQEDEHARSVTGRVRERRAGKSPSEVELLTGK